jgi:hypothetical protein
MVSNDSVKYGLTRRDFLKKSGQLILAIGGILIIETLVGGCALTIPPIRPAPAYIINTGTPTNFGWWLVEVQWVASKFTINDPGYFVTDIEGYFNPAGSADVILDITDSAGETPGKVTYYSKSFLVDHKQGANWYGIRGITDLKLPPGDYWILFRPAEQIDRIIEMPKNPPSPITNYAINTEITRTTRQWSEADDLNIGIRISGTPAP